ncbi:MAG: haloacid dehalogenase-like hydrolase, partial [Ruminococcus sp.]
RINEFGKANNVEIEHYVISSGMKEIIDGTIISKEFKNIFACEYLYDEEENAVWPKTAVNYTNKTQFVYRINKGVLDVSNDEDLNNSMPDDSKRIPFENMIYIGDGLSDVPCMKMMKSYGGKAIAVYQQLDEKVKELLRKDRVDFIYPADYRENSGLDRTVKDIIIKMTISDKLNQEYTAQLKSIG